MPALPEWVFLDAGGTLLQPHPGVGALYARAGAEHGLDAGAERLEVAFRVAWGRVDRRASPRARWGDEAACLRFWRGLVEDVFDQVGYAGDRAACFASLYGAFEEPEAWHVPRDVRPALRDLAALGVGLGVASNWDYRLPSLLDRLGLAASFALILTSAEADLEKPDPAFFTAACRRAGVDPGRALHVGDRHDLDIEPARAAGLTAWRIDRDAAGAADGASLDCLRSLTEIGERLSI